MQQGPLIVVYKEVYFERLTTKRPCCDLETAFKVGLTIAAASLGGWVRARSVPGHHEDHGDDDGDDDDIGDDDGDDASVLIITMINTMTAYLVMTPPPQVTRFCLACGITHQDSRVDLEIGFGRASFLWLFFYFLLVFFCPCQ